MRFILTADWHLRRDKPVCRLDDDWVETQRQHIERVIKLAKETKCPIYNVGDVYDTPVMHPEIEQLIPSLLIKHSVDMYVLAGNHDYYSNAEKYIPRSSIGVLFHSKHVYKLEDTEDCHFEHVLVFKDEKSMPPNVKAQTAQQLLDNNPAATYIFTGDMHHSFIYEKHNRFVINPGCLNIQVSNMKDYETGVWYVDTETNTFTWIPLPDNPELVSQAHNIMRRENNDRISAFIEFIKTKQNNTLDFWELVNSKLDIIQDDDVANNIKLIKEKIC